MAHCLCALPLFQQYCIGFSHLVISVIRPLQNVNTARVDFVEAKHIATKLFLSSISGTVSHSEIVLVKLLQAFDIGLLDIKEALLNYGVKRALSLDAAKKMVEDYVSQLLASHSFKTAVALLRHFCFRHSGKSLLLKLIQHKQFSLAKKWAKFLGKQNICIVVREYIDQNMLGYAFDVMKEHNLWLYFPDVHSEFRKCRLKRLVEYGSWDLAERKAKSNLHLVEYLVFLAMEAGYNEKANELCERYILEGFWSHNVARAGDLHHSLADFLGEILRGIIWIDNVHDLQSRTNEIEKCRIIGIDCEFGYEKDHCKAMVSIMQIASGTKVYIIDLKKLYEDEPIALNHCLVRILQNHRILKLGYNIFCDLTCLTCSFGNLDCFKLYKMLLDVVDLFKGHRGGLSGLSKAVLGIRLDKAIQESNWMERPLRQAQLQYAALDAAVLPLIFYQAPRRRWHSSDVPCDTQWKSCIINMWNMKVGEQN